MPKIQQPTETKEQAELRAQREALAQAQVNQRRADAFARRALTHWLLWELCGLKRCQRARACAGDPQFCFNLFGGVISDAPRVRVRAHIKALGEGLPPHEAAQYAEHEVAYHRLVETRRAQMQADYRTALSEPPLRVRLG